MDAGKSSKKIHTHPTKQEVPDQGLRACGSPCSAPPQSLLSVLQSILISVGHPWPPYLKSQPLQHSLSPFAALISSQTLTVSCHISWFTYLCVLFLPHSLDYHLHEGRDVFICFVVCPQCLRQCLLITKAQCLLHELVKTKCSPY